jgi:hypothetical protein
MKGPNEDLYKQILSEAFDKKILNPEQLKESWRVTQLQNAEMDRRTQYSWDSMKSHNKALADQLFARKKELGIS